MLTDLQIASRRLYSVKKSDHLPSGAKIEDDYLQGITNRRGPAIVSGVDEMVKFRNGAGASDTQLPPYRQWW